MQEKDGASGPRGWSVLIERVGDWKGISATRIIYWIRRGGTLHLLFYELIRISISLLLTLLVNYLEKRRKKNFPPSTFILRVSAFLSISILLLLLLSKIKRNPPTVVPTSTFTLAFLSIINEVHLQSNQSSTLPKPRGYINNQLSLI